MVVRAPPGVSTDGDVLRLRDPFPVVPLADEL
jgi:hypothetical protein